MSHNMALSSRSDSSGYRFYHYDPSMAAAVIFIVLFIGTTVLHLYQMFRTRTWFFIPFCIGGAMEVMGYVGRAVSASQDSGEWTTGPFALQSLFLLVAPSLLSASVYMELGRIVQLVEGDSHLMIRRTWMTKIFVCGDAVSFIMQGAGGGIMAGAKSADNITLAQNIILAGLCVQVVFFAFFLLTSVLVHRRLAVRLTPLSSATPWKKHLVALYAVSVLIFVRSAFRVVEYAQGNDGYLLQHEAYIYVFDATFMFLAMSITNWVHPSEIARLVRERQSGTSLELAKTSSRV